MSLLYKKLSSEKNPSQTPAPTFLAFSVLFGPFLLTPGNNQAH